MSLNGNKKNFKGLEEEIYKIVCELGCDMIKDMLENADRELMNSRNRQTYRHKGKRKRTIKTVMGEVEYQRNLYEMHLDDGTKAYRYLLDEAMGIDTIGSISMLLAEKITHRIMHESYRETAKTISTCTGQSISHMGVWNVTNQLGEKIKNDLRDADQSCFDDQKVVDTLFEEQDGIYVNMQKKDRGKGKRSKRELKVAVCYDGVKTASDKRRSVTGKVAYASFEKSSEFFDSKEIYFNKKYNLDEVQVRLLNGDGASWIKQTKERISSQPDGPAIYYQLDPFHRNKKARECLRDRKDQAVVFNYLKNHQIDDMMLYLNGILLLIEDEKEQEKLGGLIDYFDQNREGLRPWREQVKSDTKSQLKSVKDVPMGTMEATMGTLAIRMKKRRASWSKRGAENLAQLFCLRMSGTLNRMINRYATMELPEHLCEPVIKGLSAAEANRLIGKGYDYPNQGSLALSKYSLNPGRKAIKDLVSMRIL